MEDNKTVEKAAENDRSFGAFLKSAAKHGVAGAKWLWRVDAVKSVALTWLIRAAVPGAPILIAILDSFLSGS